MGTGVAPWSAFYVDQAEYVPELMWPTSVQVYDRMLADAKLNGLIRSIELPLQARKWAIDPNGADATSVQRLADDLDLPVVGQEQSARRRSSNRFSFGNHLKILLKALGFGFYYFEQVGEIVDGQWRLKKLAQRPPRTISEINVDKDGMLTSVRQNLGGAATQGNPELSVNRLIAYVWDYEAGNWTGRSMLRPCYRNWLIKDRLLRVDAIKHERSGMGVPMAEAPPGASKDEIEALGEMMREMKITEGGGGAVPSGTKPQLMGTTGSLPDTIASIRFHNEEMGSSFLAQFQSLGQGQAGGSYALGEVQYDFFGLALDAVECWVADTFNPYMIEDWYDWNYGEESVCARLVVEEEPDPIEQQELFNEGLNESEEAGEEELERFETQAQDKLRRLRRARAAGRRRRRSVSAAGESPSLVLPDRPLRRQPYAHEVQAQVDFAQIDAQLDSGVDRLFDEVRVHQRQQIEELRDQIVDANNDLVKLSNIQATPQSQDAILAAMRTSADMGIDQAASEATRQGVKAPKKPAVASIDSTLTTRAAATDNMLTNGISQSARRAALRFTASSGGNAVAAADAVVEYLQGLTGQFAKDQINGALSSAMTDGRKITMTQNKPTKIYSSELLDENTCTDCVAIDGTEYTEMDDAVGDYPTGGYMECQGGDRCRGTLVAVYEETET